MYKFIYKNITHAKWEKLNGNGDYVAPIIFECEAKTITEADELFKMTIGEDPSKSKGVVVSVKGN